MAVGSLVEDICIVSILDVGLGTGGDVLGSELNGNLFGCYTYARVCMYMYTPTSDCYIYDGGVR